MESNPIWIARMCGDTLVLALIKYRGKIQVKNMLEIGLLLAICFVMGSKGPLVSVFMALFLFYLIYNNKNIGKILFVFSAGILIIVALFWGIQHSNSNFIQDRFSLNSIINPAPGYRVSRYVFSISKLPSHIIEGHGLGNWTIDYWSNVKYIPNWATSAIRLKDYPHNILVEILYECGILALLPFIEGILALIRTTSLKNLSRNYISIYVLLMANLGYAMFSGSITEGNRGIYYILALYCSLMNTHKKLRFN